MFRRLSIIKKKLEIPQSHLHARWLIVCLFTIVAALEFTTSADYVFCYLYTGPILLANSRFSRLAKLQVVLVAWVLTLLNLFVSNAQPIELATVANRSIAVMALGVTGWLSDRNDRYQEDIAQAKAQLLSQQRLASMREDFVSTLSHDLKTPILGAIETIKAFQQGKFGPVAPAGTKVLATMARSHRTTLQLVETLLDVYRNDSEGLNLQIAPLNLVNLAEDVIAQLRDLSVSRRVYIDISYGQSEFRRALWVNGDDLQLMRVLINLLTNGINHSPRGGKVEIVMEYNSAYQIVKVIDNGAGITDGELPHLFERFYQGHSHRQAKGSGLGLYLSRQIIEAHGGIIWAENRLPHGALFGFRLPAIPPYETYSFPPHSTG
ncbi:two-component sensor histidine kinase [Oscillatoriales cyanobacterium USR001]|nr:two-component sensor histidine kinase [Oscillatoriales cyanobacterium USR001]